MDAGGGKARRITKGAESRRGEKRGSVHRDDYAREGGRIEET